MSSLAPGQLAPPPRRISTALQARILLGSTKSQIGWLILGLGSFLFWVFAWHADLSGWRFRPGRTVQTMGQALSCTDTGFSENGTKSRRGIPILENRYRYQAAGKTFEESSFIKEQCKFGPVTVEYLRGDPQVSRIVGMRRRPFSAAAVVTASVPAAGVVLILLALAEGRVRLRLLRDGLFATGKLVESTRTNISAENRQVYRMTFEYAAQNGVTGRATVRTNRPERLAGAAGQVLLYDPANLRRTVLIANLPGTITAGETRQPEARGSAAYLVIPALAVLGNGWYVFHHWLQGP